MKAVIYARYSSDKQTEQSIEGQMSVCHEYCKRNNITIVGEYVDRALSASKNTEKRIEFQRMIRDSEKKQFDIVIVYKLDRFSRNRYDSATYKTRLKKNGVKVVSATENISDSPEGIILESVLEGMAEFYSRELSQKVTRGMNETAKKAQSNGGKIPLGYKVFDKNFVIDEPYAEMVREAFNLFANGATYKEICGILNDKGYKTKAGYPVTHNTFRIMFRNEKYIGTYVFDKVRIENAIPPIIDKAIFEKVQERLGEYEKKPAGGKPLVNYLLGGKIFCGHCKSPMTAETGTSNTGKVYNYYTCSKRKRYKNCNKKPISKTFIEQLVFEDIINMLTDEKIDELATMAMAEYEREKKETSDLDRLQIELKSTERSIVNGLKAIDNGVISETLILKINDAEKTKKKLLKLIEEEKGVFDFLTKEMIIWWLEKSKKKAIADDEGKKILFDMLLKSVYVYDDDNNKDFTLEITCHLTDKLHRSTYSSIHNNNGSPNKKMSIKFDVFFAFNKL